MSHEQRKMFDPLTPEAGFILTADVGEPASIAAPNVYQVAADDKSEEVQKIWQFLGKLEGAAVANKTVDVILWPYDAHTGLFYPVASFEVVGVDKLDDVTGNVQQLPGIVGCTYMGVQLDGLDAGDQLRLAHNQR